VNATCLSVKNYSLLGDITTYAGSLIRTDQRYSAIEGGRLFVYEHDAFSRKVLCKLQDEIQSDPQSRICLWLYSHFVGFRPLFQFLNPVHSR
jgi:hypothetical protein